MRVTRTKTTPRPWRAMRAATIGLGALAGSLVLGPWSARGAQARPPAFRAVDASLRLYQASATYPVALNDAGQLVVEEFNTSNRGFIAHRLYTPDAAGGTMTGGAIRLLDDVVGEPSRPMPAGPVGSTRGRRLSDAGRVFYTGGLRGVGLFEPASPATPTQGATLRLAGVASTWAFNDARRIALPDPATPGVDATLSVYELGAGDAAPIGRRVSSIAFDASVVDPEPSPRAMNAAGQVVGTYQTRVGARTTAQAFLWTPDPTGKTPGALAPIAPAPAGRYEDLDVRLNDAGQTLTSVIDYGVGRFAATLSLPDGAGGRTTIDLNALLGAPNVEILDFDDRGRVLARLSEADGSGRLVTLYDPATFDPALGAARFDAADAIASLGADAVSFDPRLINAAGQVAGVAGYRRVGADGSVSLWQGAALLTPVPEPAAATLALAGVSALIRRSRGSRPAS